MRANALSDLTHDEFMKLNTLKVPDLPKGNIPYPADNRDVATSIDWRKKVFTSKQDAQD